MRAAGVAVMLGVVAATIGCGSTGVNAPSPIGLAQGPSAGPAGGGPTTQSPVSGRARIQLANLSVRTSIWPQNGNYLYEAEATLEETSGLAGARVTTVRLASPGRTLTDEATEATCWRRVIRVEAGGTLDLFSWDVLGYCAPVIAYPVPLPYVVLEVTYVDDDGHAGTLSAQLDITD